ncbi:MAG: decaprenyl-phosphate phosphoribosyltransferase [Nitrospiraceae bacterium]
MKTVSLVGHVGEAASSLLKHAGLFGRTMRPLDWTKNAFVFAPVFFSGEADQVDKLLMVGLAFLAFSAMSSAVYVFNDIHDRERDRAHPGKCERPIASGALSPRAAGMGAAALTAVAVLLVHQSPPVAGTLLAYGCLNILYTVWLKHLVILDVFSIAVGFVLRVFAGGLIIGIEPSSWLILATFLLSLFLGLAKRRHELLVMKEVANSHRPVLEQYTISLVDELISVVTPLTLITYVLYTLDAATIARFHSRTLYLTCIFVVFGIFRYLFLVHCRELGGSPTTLILKDLPLRVAILGWVLTFAIIVYMA